MVEQVRRWAARAGLSEQQREALKKVLEAGETKADPDAPPRPRGAQASGTLTPEADTWFPESLHSAVSDQPERYKTLAPLGAGGMGQVVRVHDMELERHVAMKIIRPEVSHSALAVERFRAEARLTAALGHPAVVPVHDIGVLEDGRVYFTMKEVRGRTFAEVIQDLHAGEATQWTFRRVVDALYRAAQAVAYAHARGVVHRDIKPDNIMVGEFGEVLVLDWGIAESDPSVDADFGGFAGGMSGTPAYMAPEVVSGGGSILGPAVDVYALGAILYEILCGLPAYPQKGANLVLEAIRSGPPPRLESQPPTGAVDILPPDLMRTCQKAMSRMPALRQNDAEGFAEELQSWLDGSHRRERATAIVEQAQQMARRVEQFRDEAEAGRAKARQLLEGVRPSDPDHLKSAGWSAEDQAERMELKANLLEARMEQLLNGALSVDQNMAEAHAALARLYRHKHRAAELERDPVGVVTTQHRLASHINALPANHPARHNLLAYLKGEGLLTLHTDPPGAEVLLHRFTRHRRRLAPVFVRSLGRTPLVRRPLELGSYLLVLRAEGRVDVRLPVLMERQGQWTGVAPGESESAVISLPMPVAEAPDECLVPAGWFLTGGDPDANAPLPRSSVWCHGFVIRRDPVAVGEYASFLDGLVANGDETLAQLHAGSAGDVRSGRLHFVREDDGFVGKSASGERVPEDWPVHGLTWKNALAYARWFAGETGLPWRLPCELEIEKAARGVDGRWFPWGDTFDPSFCVMRASQDGPPSLQGVHDSGRDISPFGVRSLGGLVRTWCLDRWEAAGPRIEDMRVQVRLPGPVEIVGRRAVRGGSWLTDAIDCRSATRQEELGELPVLDVGIRLVRPLDPD